MSPFCPNQRPLARILGGQYDRLYSVDSRTGAARPILDVHLELGSVGFEVHPDSGRMYACTDDAVLYEIEPVTGDVVPIGALNMPGNCGSLAALSGSIACIDI